MSFDYIRIERESGKEKREKEEKPSSSSSASSPCLLVVPTRILICERQWVFALLI